MALLLRSDSGSLVPVESALLSARLVIVVDEGLELADIDFLSLLHHRKSGVGVIGCGAD